ncbi:MULTISPECIES: transglutaminase-like cysteine peptidase [unclassified Bradyrhizobium]|uniref:transglutaminase-like cysteine peptidase n=1 Tax=unclassified Bradyrhizobium TaxID=2631580 RepID=UPI00070FF566|nr:MULTISPECIES: transglutaminase-like cysteine peptidase [unclassified Bradyrhizobium]KQT03048.1 hypothetical protein ASG57_15855 [Bradyrhizobium sp. Leaf396]
MSLKSNVGVLVAAGLVAACLASKPAQAFLARPALFAALGAATKPPTGWQQFCTENAEECRPGTDQARDLMLTPELLQELYRVNKYVNDRVTWTSDETLYGKAERWTFPLDRGDCEDIVLLKRKLLIRAGWPQGSLLITTVEQPAPASGNHAVLTVRSDRGEMILDNQTSEILFWYETKYRYLSRQSVSDPNLWVSFGTEQPKPAAVASQR